MVLKGMADLPLYAVFFVTIGLNFFFALSGKGAAIFQMPAFVWLGMPINGAKSMALLANTVSLTAVSLENFRANRLDLKLGLPVIIGSFAFAPVGAYLSTFIEKKVVMLLFVIFLVYAGISAFITVKPPPKAGGASGRNRQIKTAYLFGIGVIAGLVSGLLAVGGGAIISAFMLLLGCQAKKISMITALAVPFSSFTGFITYAAAGYISWPALVTVSGAAFLGGYLGNKTAHSFLSDKIIQQTIGALSLMLAVKIFFELVGNPVSHDL